MKKPLDEEIEDLQLRYLLDDEPYQFMLNQAEQIEQNKQDMAKYLNQAIDMGDEIDHLKIIRQKQAECIVGQESEIERLKSYSNNSALEKLFIGLNSEIEQLKESLDAPAEENSRLLLLLEQCLPFVRADVAQHGGKLLHEITKAIMKD